MICKIKKIQLEGWAEGDFIITYAQDFLWNGWEVPLANSRMLREINKLQEKNNLPRLFKPLNNEQTVWVYLPDGIRLIPSKPPYQFFYEIGFNLCWTEIKNQN
jgi:hypothetical protein